jgi:archaellum component FlaC
MHHKEFCVRRNDKVYCWSPIDGAVVEISTRIDTKTKNITDLPEEVARDLMCLMSKSRCRKPEVLSSEEIQTLMEFVQKEYSRDKAE